MRRLHRAGEFPARRRRSCASVSSRRVRGRAAPGRAGGRLRVAQATESRGDRPARCRRKRRASAEECLDYTKFCMGCAGGGKKLRAPPGARAVRHDRRVTAHRCTNWPSGRCWIKGCEGWRRRVAHTPAIPPLRIRPRISPVRRAKNVAPKHQSISFRQVRRCFRILDAIMPSVCSRRGCARFFCPVFVPLPPLAGSLSSPFALPCRSARSLCLPGPAWTVCRHRRRLSAEHAA